MRNSATTVLRVCEVCRVSRIPATGNAPHAPLSQQLRCVPFPLGRIDARAWREPRLFALRVCEVCEVFYIPCQKNRGIVVNRVRAKTTSQTSQTRKAFGLPDRGVLPGGCHAGQFELVWFPGCNTSAYATPGVGQVTRRSASGLIRPTSGRARPVRCGARLSGCAQRSRSRGKGMTTVRTGCAYPARPGDNGGGGE